MLMYPFSTAEDATSWAISNHILVLGSRWNAKWYGPVLTPQEAWAIDNKIDDGLPAYGSVMTYKNGMLDPGNGQPPLCTTSDVASSAQYRMNSDSARTCSLIFKMQY